jgi:hypothetical protein
MPVIRVLEVATFYVMFQLQPVGKVAFVQLCGTTPCQLRGALDLKAVLKAKIGEANAVSADGKFSWEEVECLGACCNAPMAAINDYYYEDLTPESLAKILDDFAAGKSPQPGSYEGPWRIGAEGRDPHPDGPKAVRRLAGQEDQDPEPARKAQEGPEDGARRLMLIAAVIHRPSARRRCYRIDAACCVLTGAVVGRSGEGGGRHDRRSATPRPRSSGKARGLREEHSWSLS